MTAIAGWPTDGEIRIKKLVIIIPKSKESCESDMEFVSDEKHTKEILQQYRHGKWWDVDIVEECIKMKGQ